MVGIQDSINRELIGIRDDLWSLVRKLTNNEQKLEKKTSEQNVETPTESNLYTKQQEKLIT